MISGRDYHGTHHENPPLHSQASVEDGQVTWQPYEGMPAVHAFHNGQYRHGPDWYRDIQYRIERERGLDPIEDWWSPGEWLFLLIREPWRSLHLRPRDLPVVDVQQIVAQERRRREVMQECHSDGRPLPRRLWAATAAYLVNEAIAQTIIAGYPWFTDWGRDTFIALPGLCLVTGRYDLARQVIEAFASQVSQGMVPNRFPGCGRAARVQHGRCLTMVHRCCG